ncbi:hypothetical protein BLNAU_13285 [Blattamonas nauphoetae]|uniref:Uncharacterized protein n=1 Tax=Blattamonas nauphoetae TaxID=2049346 RepID=A0ABQ9XMF2_9EUKA|nr:hypothetical protein BLNAU_13285 [Blattamonas nauphoetae]
MCSDVYVVVRKHPRHLRTLTQSNVRSLQIPSTPKFVDDLANHPDSQPPIHHDLALTVVASYSFPQKIINAFPLSDSFVIVTPSIFYFTIFTSLALLSLSTSLFLGKESAHEHIISFPFDDSETTRLSSPLTPNTYVLIPQDLPPIPTLPVGHIFISKPPRTIPQVTQTTPIDILPSPTRPSRINTTPQMSPRQSSSLPSRYSPRSFSHLPLTAVTTTRTKPQSKHRLPCLDVVLSTKMGTSSLHFTRMNKTTLEVIETERKERRNVDRVLEALKQEMVRDRTDLFSENASEHRKEELRKNNPAEEINKLHVTLIELEDMHRRDKKRMEDEEKEKELLRTQETEQLQKTNSELRDQVISLSEALRQLEGEREADKRQQEHEERQREMEREREREERIRLEIGKEEERKMRERAEEERKEEERQMKEENEQYDKKQEEDRIAENEKRKKMEDTITQFEQAALEWREREKELLGLLKEAQEAKEKARMDEMERQKEQEERFLKQEEELRERIEHFEQIIQKNEEVRTQHDENERRKERENAEHNRMEKEQREEDLKAITAEMDRLQAELEEKCRLIDEERTQRARLERDCVELRHTLATQTQEMGAEREEREEQHESEINQLKQEFERRIEQLRENSEKREFEDHLTISQFQDEIRQKEGELDQIRNQVASVLAENASLSLSLERRTAEMEKMREELDEMKEDEKKRIETEAKRNELLAFHNLSPSSSPTHSRPSSPHPSPQSSLSPSPTHTRLSHFTTIPSLTQPTPNTHPSLVRSPSILSFTPSLRSSLSFSSSSLRSSASSLLEMQLFVSLTQLSETCAELQLALDGSVVMLYSLLTEQEFERNERRNDHAMIGRLILELERALVGGREASEVIVKTKEKKRRWPF